MKKIFFFALLFLFLSPLFVKSPVYAMKLSVTFNFKNRDTPPIGTLDARLDTKFVLVTIYNPDNDFTDPKGQNPGFGYKLMIKNAESLTCVTAEGGTGGKGITETYVEFISIDQIKASLQIPDWSTSHCGGVGTKKIKFGTRNSNTDYGSFAETYIDETITFKVGQIGGELPKMTPTETLFGGNDKVQGLLSNARVGNSYVFWWEGQTEFVKNSTYTPQGAGSTTDKINQVIDLDRIDKSSAKLCMDIYRAGNIPFPEAKGLTCRDDLSTTFNFTTASPPKKLHCQVLPNPVENDKPISLIITGANPNGAYQSQLQKEGQPNAIETDNKNADGWGTVNLSIAKSSLPVGNYTAIGKYENYGEVCKPRLTFTVVSAAALAPAIPTIIFPSGAPILSPPPPPCITSDNDKKCQAVDTALGKIDTDPAKFIGKLFGILLGLSGGIALILIIYSGYKLMLAQGNPEAIQGARETLTSAIVGLLFIIFSVVILRVIGVDILHIPGFK